MKWKKQTTRISDQKKSVVSSWQFFVTFLGWLSAPFKWLSDLQLGDEKVTKNHLAGVFSRICHGGKFQLKIHVYTGSERLDGDG